MRCFSYLGLGLVVLILSTPALSSDQQKAEKQLRKITAMATDGTGRRVVSITVADTLAAGRPSLVLERRAMNVNYGDVFVVHWLVKNGAKMEDIAAQLKAGKKIDEIANAAHTDWQALAEAAKKLNSNMEENLYKHFVDGKADAARDLAEGYDPMIDGVTADNDVPKSDITDAEHTYQRWRDRADKAKDSRLDAASEKSAQSARGDPVRSKAGSLAPPKY
jgi:hypothetical protein